MYQAKFKVKTIKGQISPQYIGLGEEGNVSEDKEYLEYAKKMQDLYGLHHISLGLIARTWHDYSGHMFAGWLTETPEEIERIFNVELECLNPPTVEDFKSFHILDQLTAHSSLLNEETRRLQILAHIQHLEAKLKDILPALNSVEDQPFLSPIRCINRRLNDLTKLLS